MNFVIESCSTNHLPDGLAIQLDTIDPEACGDRLLKVTSEDGKDLPSGPYLMLHDPKFHFNPLLNGGTKIELLAYTRHDTLAGVFHRIRIVFQ